METTTSEAEMPLMCRMRLSIASSKCCRYVCGNISLSWPAGFQHVFGIDVYSPMCPQMSNEALEHPVAHVITGCIWPGWSDFQISFCLFYTHGCKYMPYKLEWSTWLVSIGDGLFHCGLIHEMTLEWDVWWKTIYKNGSLQKIYLFQFIISMSAYDVDLASLCLNMCQQCTVLILRRYLCPSALFLPERTSQTWENTYLIMFQHS